MMPENDRRRNGLHTELSSDAHIKRTLSMNAKQMSLLTSLLVMLVVSRTGAKEPICRIAAVSSPYITTLSAEELGERRWIEQIAPAGLETSIAMVNAVEPDAMIVLGSLTWSGSEADLLRAKSFLDRIEVPFYVLPGERDVTDGEDVFNRVFGGQTVDGKSINVKGVHIQFTSLNDSHTGEGHRKILEQMKSGLSAARDARAVLLFGGADIRPPGNPNATASIQTEYWSLINDYNVAARFTAGHSHTVRYDDRLPIWSIPSSGWSYTPKWPIALISVYEKKIELDLVHEGGQPLQRLVVPNPANAARMVAASNDPFGIPTYSEDLKLKPNLTFVQLSDSQFDDGSVSRYKSRFAMDEKMNELAVVQVNRLKPALAFMTGDLTNKNTKAECETFNRIHSKLNAPFYPVPGNHDTLYDRAKLNREAFGDLFGSGMKNWQLADQLAGGKATDRTTLYRHFTKKDPYYTVEKGDCAYQIYHVFDDHIVACWKPIFRADGNRPLYERVVLPEPRYVD
jgi:predicted MPP superfamily phosphohydrolase